MLTKWLGRRSEHESIICWSSVGRWCKAPAQRSGQELQECRGQGPKPVMAPSDPGGGDVTLREST